MYGQTSEELWQVLELEILLGPGQPRGLWIVLREGSPQWWLDPVLLQERWLLRGFVLLFWGILLERRRVSDTGAVLQTLMSFSWI